MTPYPRRIWPLYSSIPIMMPYHYAHYSKRKGGQVRFTATQTDALEKRFNSNKYLSPEDRRLLADSLKLTDRQVKAKKSKKFVHTFPAQYFIIQKIFKINSKS